MPPHVGLGVDPVCSTHPKDLVQCVAGQEAYTSQHEIELSYDDGGGSSLRYLNDGHLTSRGTHTYMNIGFLIVG